MMNPGWKNAIAAAWSDLREGGVFAAIDFYESPVDLFRRQMQVNHVAVEAHLLGEIDVYFGRTLIEFDRAYLGLWRYSSLSVKNFLSHETQKCRYSQMQIH
ncbi:MAG: hypothetical protein M2R45_00206 [Verrucomicrobia subdivision 3 bacterium]|nr:hypothetical protein [Limisphaerales bacterium]MCS1412336.1 hypothetical protein [Limisphaerales bacterium]